MSEIYDLIIKKIIDVQKLYAKCPGATKKDKVKFSVVNYVNNIDDPDRRAVYIDFVYENIDELIDVFVGLMKDRKIHKYFKKNCKWF